MIDGSLGYETYSGFQISGTHQRPQQFYFSPKLSKQFFLKNSLNLY